jgi:hypothetical protein
VRSTRGELAGRPEPRRHEHRDAAVTERDHALDAAVAADADLADVAVHPDAAVEPGGRAARLVGTAAADGERALAAGRDVAGRREGEPALHPERRAEAEQRGAALLARADEAEPRPEGHRLALVAAVHHVLHAGHHRAVAEPHARKRPRGDHERVVRRLGPAAQHRLAERAGGRARRGRSAAGPGEGGSI